MKQIYFKVLLMFLLGMFSFGVKAQDVLNKKIDVNIANQDFKSALGVIENSAGVKFTYRKSLVDPSRRVSLKVSNEKMSVILGQLLTGTGLKYEIIGKQIILIADDSNTAPIKTSKAENEIPIKRGRNKDVTITGKVVDADGLELVGANIRVEGTTIGTSTDIDGKYELLIPAKDTDKVLVFSYISYQSQRVFIDDRDVIDAVLVSAMLEEVVVVGYGTMKKSDLTGAISSIKTKASDATQFSSVDALMRGRAAGIQVVQAGGDPGGAISVKIRGLNSLRGDNEPLYVIDGVIVNNVTSDNSDPFSSKTSNSGQTRQSGLTGINPQDVESIEILKDASATAIYGSRGANGVVLITTKKGQGITKTNFSSTWEVASVSKNLEMLDAVGYANYINDVRATNNFSPRYGLDTLIDVNWQRELQRKAFNKNNRLVVSGSSTDDKTTYYLAAGFLQNQGIVRNSGLNQGDIKLNFSQELTSKLKLNLTLSGVANKNLMSVSTEPLGGGDNSMITKMLVGIPILNANVSLDDPSTPYDNPLSWLKDYDDIGVEKRVLSGLNLVYKFNKALSYKLTLAGDYKTKERKRWFGPSTFNGKVANGSLGLSNFDRTFYQLESLLLFNKKLKENSKISGTAGFTYDNENITRSSVINENFFTDELRTEGFGFGQLVYPFLRDRSKVEVFSFLTRTNFNFNEKYLLTLSGRADGTSKFGPGNKFSFFPAAAFAVRLDEEDFVVNSEMLSSLKWRVGYGRSGNQAISPYGTFARYNDVQAANGNAVVVGSVPVNIQNKDLKWETTDQFNTGLDFGLKSEKYSFTIDAYYKRTYDLLQTFNLPTSSGFDRLLQNIGTIENKGIEFSGIGHMINTPKVKLDLSGNISFNRNKILDLGLDNSNFGIFNWEAYIGGKVSNGTYFKEPANVFVVGQPIGIFYGYQTDGVYQTVEETQNVLQFGLPVVQGDLKLIDQNKDGDISPDDKVIIGNPNPKFTYGFNSNLSFNKFRVDLFFNGVYGNEIINGNLFRLGNANGSNSNNILKSTYENAWTLENPTDYPRVGYDNLALIDSYVENGSFLRLATATLGYDFELGEKSKFKNISLNLIGRNLLTFTNYSGFDPEVNSFTFDGGIIGVDWSSYPNLKAYSVNINLTF